MKKRKILRIGIIGSLAIATPIVSFTYYGTQLSRTTDKNIPTILKTNKNISTTQVISQSSQSDNQIVDGVIRNFNVLSEVIYFGTNEGLKKLEKGVFTIIDTMDLTNGFVYQTKNKDIYFGSDKGLKKYSNGKVTLISSKSFKFGYMLEAKDGTLYAGSWRDGLFKVVNDKLVLFNKIDVGGGFILQAPDGKIYVGTFRKGFNELQPDGQYRLISSYNFERTFWYQTQDGTIYVSSYARGLWKLENGSLKNVSKTDVGKGFMYQTQDGTIYVGTYLDGLKKLVDGKLERVSSTQMDAGYMYQTQDGTVYVGLSNGSLKKLVNGQLVDTNLMGSSTKTYFTLSNQTNAPILTTLQNASTSLPSTLNNPTTPAALGFIDPTQGKRNGATVSFKTKSFDDTNGTLEVEATVTKGAVSKIKTFTLNGFQTTAQSVAMNQNILDNLLKLFDPLKNPVYKDVYVGQGKKGLKKLVNGQLMGIDPLDMSSGSMFQAQDGTIYVKPADGSLKKLVNGSFRDVLPSELDIRFIYQTEDGTIYLNSDLWGLKKLSNIKTEDVHSSLALYDVWFMHEANDGTIYFASKEGKLEKIDESKLSNPTLVKTKIEDIDLENGFFYETQDNTIYVGTKSNGLKKIVNNKLEDVDQTDVGTGFMYQTKNGTIYVGTKSNGLKVLDNGKLIDFDPTDVGDGFMYQTKGGSIYVGTKSQGLKTLVNGKLIEVDPTNLESGFMYQTKDNAFTTLQNAGTTLPRALKNATTPAALGFTDPTQGKRNGATVSFAIKTVNDNDGILGVEATITRSGVTKYTNFNLIGFQTQAEADRIKADLDQKHNDALIKNWDLSTFKGAPGTLPSNFGKIDRNTLKSLTGLSLPTLTGRAREHIKATPNNTNGTIELAIVIATPGASRPISAVINKVLTGFQTQAEANRSKADAHKKANEALINGWNNLAVNGAKGTLPSDFGNITDGATLYSLTGLSLPDLEGGATAAITATPDDANGSISLSIVVTTPGATKSSSTAINKVLTGFQTQAEADTIKADADQQANETLIKNWNNLAVRNKRSILPSMAGTITDPITLTKVTGLAFPILSKGANVDITATPNNANGTISLAIVVNTLNATPKTAETLHKVLTGFQTQAEANVIKANADQKANEQAINDWNTLAVEGVTGTLPSNFGKITDETKLSSLTGLSLPTLVGEATAAITATPNNTNGTISLAIVVTTPGATNPASATINKVLTGFQTQADADQKVNEDAINNWNTLAVSGKTNTLPSDFGKITDRATLTYLTGLSLPTLKGGATTKITATPNDTNGTISLAIVVTTPNATNPVPNPIRKTLTGFQTQGQATTSKADNDQKANEDAINNWSTLAVSNKSTTLPSAVGSITNGITLKSVTGLSLPTLSGSATTAITATSNNTDGTISLKIVITTPNATNPVSNPINQVLTGFQTQDKANKIKADTDQQANEKAINDWMTLAVSGESATLPSDFGKITDGATLTSLTGLSLPTLSSGATTKITATPNDTNGKISLAIVVTTPGATTPASNPINKDITGFQTQAQADVVKADADQRANEDAINNWNTLTVSGKSTTLPSDAGSINSRATLTSLTGLSLPNLTNGATTVVTATPNNTDGTIKLEIVVTTPGATKAVASPIYKTLTGFQTQVEANKIKADKDQIDNQKAINDWNTLAVEGVTGTLPSKFGKITDGATLYTLTGLSLPDLEGGATTAITATPNNTDGKIELSIVATTPGATNPKATAINKELTGFQNQADYNKIKADADQRASEDAINNWNTLAVSNKANILPSEIGAITDFATLKNKTGLSLPTLVGDATAAITATPNNANGTISLSIVATTPGATTPVAPAIHKVLTGFETINQRASRDTEEGNLIKEVIKSPQEIKEEMSRRLPSTTTELISKLDLSQKSGQLKFFEYTGLHLPDLSKGEHISIFKMTPIDTEGKIKFEFKVGVDGATSPKIIKHTVSGFKIDSGSSKLSRNAIIGIAIGSVAFLGIMIFLLRYFRKNKKAKAK